MTSINPLETYITELGQRAKQAARTMVAASDKQKSQALHLIAERLISQQNVIIDANQEDYALAKSNGLAPAMLDRLALQPKTIQQMATGLRQIAMMPNPVGSMGETRLRPNGMRVTQMRVPLGVIGIIYESRPNVTIDATALCIKSGNATILRGGSEALRSNLALAKIIRSALVDAKLPEFAVQVLNRTEREAVSLMARLDEYIDIIIPRGGRNLVERITKEAKVPLIKHLDGNCHVYVDEYANLETALNVAVNAKTYRYGICGAMETLLVHQHVAAEFIPKIAQTLTEKGVELRVCKRAKPFWPNAVDAQESDWDTEFTAPILALKVVGSLDEAITHINQHGSQHTDSIVTQNIEHANQFTLQVDSSSTLVNLPTCFADGYEYGLGAEIGISTNKLHARGPVGLEGLMTYKWVLQGEGQLRGE